MGTVKANTQGAQALFFSHVTKDLASCVVSRDATWRCLLCMDVRQRLCTYTLASNCDPVRAQSDRGARGTTECTGSFSHQRCWRQRKAPPDSDQPHRTARHSNIVRAASREAAERICVTPREAPPDSQAEANVCTKDRWREAQFRTWTVLPSPSGCMLIEMRLEGCPPIFGC